ncbi:hypothetical protein ACM66B_001503 [Microbotryomycetes sp. NB124-2]
MPPTTQRLTELGYPPARHKFIRGMYELQEGLVTDSSSDEDDEGALYNPQTGRLEIRWDEGAHGDQGTRKRGRKDEHDSSVDPRQHKHAARLAETGSRQTGDESSQSAGGSRSQARSDLHQDSTPVLTTPSDGPSTGRQQPAVKDSRTTTSNKLGKLPPPPLVAALKQPTAPAGSTSRLKRHKSPALEFTQPPEDSDIEIIDESHTNKKGSLATHLKPLSSSKNISPQKGPMKPPATKLISSKAKKKQSFEDALRYVESLKKAKAGDGHLYKIFPTISDLVEFLAPLRPTHVKNHLDGCRIIFVNTNKKKATDLRNCMDVALPLNMYNVVRNGGELVKPEDFVPSPPDADRSDKSFERANKAGWTTHVIPLILPNYPRPTFEEVLENLGPRGVTLQELGPFVHVVDMRWLSNRITLRSDAPMSELQHTWPDDPRIERATVELQQTRPARSTRKYSASDSEGEEEAVNTEANAISPFGEHDYPPGELPPPQNDTPDASQASAGEQVIEGLEDELQYVRQRGIELFDEEMEHFDKVIREEEQEDARKNGPMMDEYTILSKRNRGDFETDVESEEERRPSSSRSPEKHEGFGCREALNGKKKFWRKRPKGGSYACDRSSTGGVHETSVNEDIARVLDNFKLYYKGDVWREKGYGVAANALRNTPYRVDNYEAATEINGIGEKIATRIVEISRFGKAVQLEHASGDSKLVQLFSGIYGVGKPVSEQLIALGARTLDDLRREPAKYNLTEAQSLGLKYYDDLQLRIPRQEVTELYGFAQQAARRIDPKLEIHCMGSYKRGQPDCGDIDLLVTRDPSDGKTHRGMIRKLWALLEHAGVAKHKLSESDDLNDLDAKINALCALPKGGKMRRMDILGVPFDEMPAAMIYFTGNDYFNRSMRLKASHLGYRLNQRGLYSGVIRGKNREKLTEGTKVDCKTEKDIFDRLRVPYRPPHERLP